MRTIGIVIVCLSFVRAQAEFESLENQNDYEFEAPDDFPENVVSVETASQLLTELLAAGMLQSEQDAADLLVEFAPDYRDMIDSSQFPFIDVLTAFSEADLVELVEVHVFTRNFHSCHCLRSIS